MGGRQKIKIKNKKKITYRIFDVHIMFPVEIKIIFAGKPSVFRVEILFPDVYGGHLRHPTPLDITLPFPEGFYRSPKHERGENSNPDRR